MKTTGALFLVGVLLVVAPIATGLHEGTSVIRATLGLGFLLVAIATVRGLVKGPPAARWAVVFWWGSVAALAWAWGHVQLIGPAVEPSRQDPGIPQAGVAFILSVLLFALSIIFGLRAYLAERAVDV